MPRKQILKVFRTPIGFHDAYVAAPSQKAALAAWGSDADLFARGTAEKIDDPELTREPLDEPGKVIRRLRGTAEEQIAALPKNAPRKAPPAERDTLHTPSRQPNYKQASRPPARPKPRPDRTALEEAKQALAKAEARHKAELDRIAKREAELERERRELEKRQQTERTKLARKEASARSGYERALRDWKA